jgi:hypothetical protein
MKKIHAAKRRMLLARKEELYIAYCLGCMLAELIGTRYLGMVNIGLADKSSMEREALSSTRVDSGTMLAWE